MKRRVTGFKKVVPDLIRANPGLTAKEYAKIALDQGLCGSASQKSEEGRVFSLATTLMKEVREGRMPGVKTIEGERPQRFYLDNSTSNEARRKIADDIVKKALSRGRSPELAEAQATEVWDKPITILLPVDIAQTMDMLVEVSRFGNRSEALIWLAREGIKAKSLELAQVEKVVEQIKQLKKSVPV